jgi:hypothetical protein
VWSAFASLLCPFYTFGQNFEAIRWNPFNPIILYLFEWRLYGLLKQGIRYGFNINDIGDSNTHILHYAVTDRDAEFFIGLGTDVNRRTEVRRSCAFS